MSSFFTVPGAQKKRKRATAPEAPKKRIATAKKPSSAGKAAASASSRQRPKSAAAPRQKQKQKSSQKAPAERDDESISGSDSDESEDEGEASERIASDEDSDESDHEGETAAERRLRLAERYLANVRQEVAVGEGDEYGFDAEDVDRDLIAERLQEDVAEAKGRVYRRLASELAFGQASRCLFRWNAENVNGVATCAPYAYTVSNDSYLTKWRIQDLPQNQWQQTTKKKPKKPPAPPKRRPERVKYRRGDARKVNDRTYQGHVGPILAVAASQDGKYVVTAGADKRLVVHDAETLKPVRVFRHHRDAVTGLVFRRGTNQLYSCSKDRTVKVWSLDELAYVETLFGHQSDVVDIDALAQERCVSVGARDRTARLWKVVEETQLVFRGGGGVSSDGDKKKKKSSSTQADENGADAAAAIDPNSMAHEGSMDRVAMIDDELFVTGSDNGSIALWSTQKKKPLFVVPRAHGLEDPLPPVEASAEEQPGPDIVPPPQPRWITALRTVPYSDVILSGSWDGCVRVWRLSEDKKKIEAVGVLGGREGQEGPVEEEEKEEVETNGINGHGHSHHHHHHKERQQQKVEGEESRLIKGVVNDIASFERGERGRDGLCVVVAVGKEHRLGRWKRVPGAKNGAVVFEVPRLAVAEAKAKAKGAAAQTNGVHGPPSDGED